MKISKSRIKKMINESLKKIMNEEDSTTQSPATGDTSAETGLEKKFETHFQTPTSSDKVLKSGVNKVPDEELIKNFQIWYDNASYHLISKKDPDYKKITQDARCIEFSITQGDIDNIRQDIKDAQRGVRK